MSADAIYILIITGSVEMQTDRTEIKKKKNEIDYLEMRYLIGLIRAAAIAANGHLVLK
jgi:hypothetical protein